VNQEHPLVVTDMGIMKKDRQTKLFMIMLFFLKSLFSFRIDIFIIFEIQMRRPITTTVFKIRQINKGSKEKILMKNSQAILPLHVSYRIITKSTMLLLLETVSIK
jgi:hypothetical protein